MPVRKIPKNYLYVTGKLSTNGQGPSKQFESLLERDYYTLLRADLDVESFEVQPVKIRVGRGRFYVPDVLIHYKQHAPARRPRLVEVKPAAILRQYKDELEPKFEAARRHAADRDWDFRIEDESGIHVPKLTNLQFLQRYARRKSDSRMEALILAKLKSACKPVPATELIAAVAGDEPPDRWWPELYSAICRRSIRMDWEQPITARSLLTV